MEKPAIILGVALPELMGQDDAGTLRQLIANGQMQIARATGISANRVRIAIEMQTGDAKESRRLAKTRTHPDCWSGRLIAGKTQGRQGDEE